MSPEAFLLMLVLALVAYRLAELVVYDDGPLNVFARLRAWTRMYDRDAYGVGYAGATRFQVVLGKILECPYCAGMYFALAGAGLWGLVMGIDWSLRLLLLPVVWLGIAGAQSALESIASRERFHADH